jgi:tRNA-specific 2-thiouridylase
MMRVAVALSGGVDSAVAAVLLKRQGFDVIGVTMRVRGQDSADARRVAESLGIPWHLRDLGDTFELEVVEPFCREYKVGRTPNPCIRCNERVKFGALLREARKLGAERLATGHYARVEQDEEGSWRLRKGRDEDKDQSYFLYRLTQEQLAQVLMPVGEHTKRQVRELAREFGLEVADKDESQEICFIPDDDYVRFLRERCPEAFEPEGLGIPFPGRRYVVRIEPETNAVILGEEQDVYSRIAGLEDVHWVSGRVPEAEFRAVVRIRSQHPGQAATVKPESGNRAEVTFDEPQWAIAPGQAAVFYEEDVVLGGGVIRAAGHEQDSETEEEEL